MAGTYSSHYSFFQVWSGLGLFQLSILSSSNSSNTSSPYSAPSSSSRSSTNGGILLGLTLLSSKSDAHAPLTQLSAQAGAVFESLASGAGSTFSTNANASSIQGPSFGDVDMATAQFGSGAGGAPGKAVPHSGTGMVRMWNLDAIRIIVGFALDGEVSDCFE